MTASAPAPTQPQLVVTLSDDIEMSIEDIAALIMRDVPGAVAVALAGQDQTGAAGPGTRPLIIDRDLR